MSSFFRKLFGRSTQQPQVTPTDAVQKLRQTEEMLRKKQEYLEHKQAEEIEKIRMNLKINNKRACIQALKRKKRIDQQLAVNDGTLTMVEYQREALESAASNSTIVQSMATAGAALKQAHQELSVEKVEELMDDICEQQQQANEIAKIISNPIQLANSVDVDEEELMKELEAMEQEELNKKLVDTEINLPTVNTSSSTLVVGKKQSKQSNLQKEQPTKMKKMKVKVKIAQRSQRRHDDQSDDDEIGQLISWAK